MSDPTKLGHVANVAQSFLMLYSPDKPARFSAPCEPIRNPNALIQRALDEAQFVLNQTVSTGVKEKSRALAKLRIRQLVVNGLHFVTASGFALLLAGRWPEVMKWGGTAVSLAAGVLGLTIPTTLANSERQLFDEIDEISELSGRIVRLQAQLMIADGDLSDAAQSEALTILERATTFAKRSHLDQIAIKAGALPRQPAAVASSLAAS